MRALQLQLHENFSHVVFYRQRFYREANLIGSSLGSHVKLSARSITLMLSIEIVLLSRKTTTFKSIRSLI